MADSVAEEVATENGLVIGDPLAAMAVAVDGTILPVSVGSIEFARSREWEQYGVDDVFNAIFYSALEAAGVGEKEAQADITLLTKYRLSFRMTRIQVRVAYGVEKGVIGRHGRFNPSKLDGCDWEVRLLESKARRQSKPPEVRVFDDNEWDRLETDALAACAGLPDQVDIAVEFRWIRCNLHQAPWFKGAPSQGAIKDWLTVMAPGPDQKARQMKFTELAWNKRLTPGDKKAKPAAFKEDAAGESEADEEAKMAEWNKRMFGKEKGDA
jgi:hypothetical protein